MSEFFQPFRRKLGMLVLVVTCVFMAAWIRSQTTIDVIGRAPGRVLSWDGSILVEAGPFDWLSLDWQTYHDWEGIDAIFERYPFFKWEWRFCGIRKSNHDPPYWVLPYGYIVIPLTLLSAWLLLSKPRPGRGSARLAMKLGSQ